MVSVEDFSDIKLSGDIKSDTDLIAGILKNDGVLRQRTVKPKNTKAEFTLFYLDGMTDSAALSEYIVKPLTLIGDTAPGIVTAHYICEKVLFANEVSYKRKVSEILRDVLYGDTVLLISGSETALTVNTKGFRTRAIDEPADERITQGPREGFCESVMVNISLIRRKLITPDLCIKPLKLGRRTDTAVYVCYLESLVKKEILDELYKRISKIDIDGVLDSNYIAEYIRDNKISIFKTVGSTERPDITAARLLEGRVALIVDGTPVALTLPYLFSENFQSDEDYYLSFLVSSVRRFLRYICFIAAVSVPALFIALTTFHIELMPTHFAISVAGLRMGVPISSVGECLLLVVVFEVLKEAGIRMSQSLGHALSIVGGLVVGQAAVEAKIISAPMLIAVAFSGICGLMVPRLKTSILYLRVISVLASALFGLYGFMAVGSVCLIRVLSISSFGVDYTLSLDGINYQAFKDTVFRAPWPKMIKRPPFSKDIKRSSGGDCCEK